MKMIDATLQELWAIKDSIAKEQGYELDNLLDYLNQKYHPSQAAQDSVQIGPAPRRLLFVNRTDFKHIGRSQVGRNKPVRA
jgi:hypothetical protein